MITEDLNMKYTPGPTIGAASGSVGGSTYSHNRYGPYIRTRAIPVNPNTTAQQNARSRLATYSAKWQTLTTGQQKAWNAYALENPITNSLGMQQALTGQVAYVGINTRLAQATDTAIDAPPLSPAPTSLVTLSTTLDIGLGTFVVTFTATPLSADDRLWIQAAVTTSPGINYIRNLLRVVKITDKAQASDYDDQADIESVFGTLAVGQTVHTWASVFDSATGLLSTPLSTSGLVVST